MDEQSKRQNEYRIEFEPKNASGWLAMNKRLSLRRKGWAPICVVLVAMAIGLCIFFFLRNNDNARSILPNTAQADGNEAMNERGGNLQPPGSPVIVNLHGENITSELLAVMIDSGDIPIDVTRLVLSENQIVDLEPLQRLTNLKELILWYNLISDLTPLRSMTHLTELNVGNNLISDTQPLQDLMNLVELNVGGTQVNDLSSLQGLTNLVSLDLGGNEPPRSKLRGIVSPA